MSAGTKLIGKSVSILLTLDTLSTTACHRIQFTGIKESSLPSLTLDGGQTNDFISSVSELRNSDCRVGGFY